MIYIGLTGWGDHDSLVRTNQGSNVEGLEHELETLVPFATGDRWHFSKVLRSLMSIAVLAMPGEEVRFNLGWRSFLLLLGLSCERQDRT